MTREAATAPTRAGLLRLLRLYARYSPVGFGRERVAERVLLALQEAPPTNGAAIHEASMRGPSMRVAVTKMGTKLLVETNDLVQAYIYLFGIWEPSITRWIARTLRPGDTFVDVGANVGYYSILASRLVGRDGSVVAIEPSPHFSAMLRKNLELNDCANVRVVNVAAAVGRDTGMPFYQPDPHNRGITTGVLAGRELQASFTADTAALADILTAQELRRVRLIKIDVEGLELAALRGLVPVLAGMRPDLELIVEISPELLAAQGYAPSDILDLLAGYGYHAFRIPNDYLMSGYIGRQPPDPPSRWTAPVTQECDLVFSRADSETL